MVECRMTAFLFSEYYQTKSFLTIYFSFLLFYAQTIFSNIQICTVRIKRCYFSACYNNGLIHLVYSDFSSDVSQQNITLAECFLLLMFLLNTQTKLCPICFNYVLAFERSMPQN